MTKTIRTFFYFWLASLAATVVADNSTTSKYRTVVTLSNGPNMVNIGNTYGQPLFDGLFGNISQACSDPKKPGEQSSCDGTPIKMFETTIIQQGVDSGEDVNMHIYNSFYTTSAQREALVHAAALKVSKSASGKNCEMEQDDTCESTGDICTPPNVKTCSMTNSAEVEIFEDLSTVARMTVVFTVNAAVSAVVCQILMGAIEAESTIFDGATLELLQPEAQQMLRAMQTACGLVNGGQSN